MLGGPERRQRNVRRTNVLDGLLDRLSLLDETTNRPRDGNRTFTGRQNEPGKDGYFCSVAHRSRQTGEHVLPNRRTKSRREQRTRPVSLLRDVLAPQPQRSAGKIFFGNRGRDEPLKRLRIVAT
jgi:hypothetical protein